MLLLALVVELVVILAQLLDLRLLALLQDAQLVLFIIVVHVLVALLHPTLLQELLLDLM